jgi:hypothetical protein
MSLKKEERDYIDRMVSGFISLTLSGEEWLLFRRIWSMTFRHGQFECDMPRIRFSSIEGSYRTVSRRLADLEKKHLIFRHKKFTGAGLSK